jgi:transaldolase
MNPLRQLVDAGQSIWLDYLRRSLITEGGLQRLVEEDGVGGLTSNPTILGRAIVGSTDYDDSIRELAFAGETDARKIFYELALQDVRMAADVFRPVFDRLEGADGYASFELEPSLAHDTQGSIDAARALVEKVGRPNLMIKVPGTPEGVPAVEELTAGGVNVNITLLFSVEMYERVARAYIAGLERRLDAGQPIDRVASVASFFVSRVDGKLDVLLPEGSPLKGKVAIANAKVAYARFQEIFSGPSWERLAAAGAKLQRPLWASTGTKNPDYSDVLYVEELIAPHTVNTMPEATLEAFRDHGTVRPLAATEDVDKAEKVLALLRDDSVDLDEITGRLVDEGLGAFITDFDTILDRIDERIREARSIGPRG